MIIELFGVDEGHSNSLHVMIIELFGVDEGVLR
jgi:hypothetical protein